MEKTSKWATVLNKSYVKMEYAKRGWIMYIIVF